MAITYGTALQDAIALLLSRSSYNNLTPSQKIAIDGDSAAATPTAGAAGRASDVLIQYASAYTNGELAFSAIPETWEAWFVQEAAMQALSAFPSAEATTVISVARATRSDALGSFARVAFNSSANTNIGAMTVLSLRAFAISNAVRANSSVIVDPSLIDAAIEEAVIEIWNDADWSFKESEVDITIAITTGVVTYGGGLKPDRLLSNRIRYTGTDGGVAVHVDRETNQDFRSDDTISSGQPKLFQLLRGPNDLVWLFDKAPDKEYTAQAMFTLQTPSMTSQETMNIGLARFPVDFYPAIRNRVLAVALRNVGRVTAPNDLFARSGEVIQALLPRYDKVSLGPPESAYIDNRPGGMGYNTGHLGGGGL